MRWYHAITKQEHQHLKDAGAVTTLKGFWKLREGQKRIERKSKYTTVACYACRDIDDKLRKAGKGP